MKTTALNTELASEEDLIGLKGLLQSVNLPTEDLPSPLKNFMVVKDNERVVASVGLELYGKYALLRSLAADPNYRNLGIANRLFEEIIAMAKAAGVEEVYSITTTADQYFAKRGFTAIIRAAVPYEIKNTAQFTGVCPSSAIVMNKRI